MNTVEQDAVPAAGICRHGGWRAREMSPALRTWLVAGVAIAGLAILFRLVFPQAYLGYDQMYALIWGRELGGGELPFYDVPLAPTAHPLPILVAALASVAGDLGAYHVLVTLAYISLAALVYGVFELGRLAFTWPVGLVAAALVATSFPILSRALTGFLDIPFVALILLAAVLEVRRPRRGFAVLGVLAVAGLVRPEAWVLAAAYWLYLVPVLDWRGRLGTAALVVAAPCLWALSDLAVTGSAIFATTEAREAARPLSGPQITFADNITALFESLRNILRLPVLAGALLGGAIAAAVARERARVPAALTVLGLATFLGLVVFDLPRADRLLFLPAVMLALFCAFALVGWISRQPGRLRRGWVLGAMLVAALLVASVPGHASRLQRLDDLVTAQRTVNDDLRALTRSAAAAPVLARCRPIAVPTHTPQPLLAYHLELAPAQIRNAELVVPRRGAVVAPATPRAAAFALNALGDPSRPYQAPPGFRRVARNATWAVYIRGC